MKNKRHVDTFYTTGYFHLAKIYPIGNLTL